MKSVPTTLRKMQNWNRSNVLVFAMTGAVSLPGGIACLNRNILRTLDKLCQDRGLTLHVLSLHEKISDRPDFVHDSVIFSAFEGNIKTFSVQLIRHGLLSKLVVFDHVSLSIPILPFVKLNLIRTVIVAHGPEAWKKVRKRSKISYRAAESVLANSQFTLSKMQGTFDGFNGVVCPLGLNPDVRLHDEIPERIENIIQLQSVDGETRAIGKRAFLLVGRMDSRQSGKGHDILIRALPEVRRRFPDAQLVFPGPGNGRPVLEELAHELGVSDAVFLPGFVTTETLHDLYCSAFAFTMPSQQDGFGLVYLEAMNFGKACIGCFDDGGESVITDHVTGRLLDPNDGVDGLTEILLGFCDDPQSVQHMGHAGFKKLHEEFSASAFQERFANHIRPLLS